MPWVEVTVLESRLTSGTSEALVQALGEAVVSILGETVRGFTYVCVNGVARERFGSPSRSSEAPKEVSGT